MVEDSTIADGDKKIIELTEVYDERGVQRRSPSNGKNPQQIIVIDGRRYDRTKAGGQHIYDLTEVVEDNDLTPQMRDAVLKLVTNILGRVAHEVVRDIAERVIREELEKIKTSPKEFFEKKD